jgi:pimeloyl-ACP methyl ester carboxylesterase
MNSLPKIVLIHGAWANGSAWGAVIQRLQADGYHVTSPQLPMSSLDEDVARAQGPRGSEWSDPPGRALVRRCCHHGTG